ncbi:organic cation transporter protein-like [Tubulanus polymorphus]|uniref:organic cation transporter protein-like n=1 Tax=Tubulanus polymorphus TaxID=672921 RepID=UPI003DA545CC
MAESEQNKVEALDEETSFINKHERNNSPSDRIDVKFDDIFESLGDLGFYQLLVFVMSNLLELSGTVSVMYFIFECADPGWKCASIECANSCVNLSMPNSTDGFCSTENLICVNRTFNPTFTSALTEWNLICSEFWKTKVIQSVFFVGLIPGAFVGGQVCDSYGRRHTILIMWILLSISQVGLRFTSSYITYVVIRFITGCLAGAIVCVAPVLSIEWISPKWRIIASWRFSWQFSPVVVALLAYLCRDWKTLTTAVGLITIPLLPVYMLIYPESPRWLVQKGSLKGAEYWVRKAFRLNRLSPPDDLATFLEDLQRSELSSAVKRSTYLDLFHNKEYSKWTIVIALSSFGLGLTWYGVNSSISSLLGNMYLNVAFSGSGSIFVGIVSLYTNNRMGRVRGFCMYMVMMGICYLIIIAIELIGKSEEYGTVITYSAIVSLALCAGCWSGIITSCCELYPTLMRNISNAMLGAAVRFAAVLSPQISLLTAIHPVIPYILYATFTFGFGVLVLLSIPETVGKPLPDSYLQKDEKPISTTEL